MKRSPEVFFRRNRSRWRQLPASIRTALLRGVSEVDQVRTEIARSAQVSSMPLVRIIDAIWSNPARNASVDGRSTFIRVGGRDFAGVELPAQVVVCGDDGVIRTILVHEFAHCFHYLTLIVNLVDSGQGDSLDLSGPHDVFTHEEFDRQMLVDPADWFGVEDANAFAFWNDKRLKVVTERMLELELPRFLPVEVPLSKFSAQEVAIPVDVMEHIRRLRDRQGDTS